ncbi:MAG: hypothetical protein ABIS18_03280 [Actinomycetota bacterium]
MGTACKAPATEDPRLDKLGASLRKLESATERLSELDAMQADSAAFATPLAELRTAFDGLKADIEKNRVGDDALLVKVKDVSGKIDSLSVKMTAFDKRLLLLETRFNDHARHP